MPAKNPYADQRRKQHGQPKIGLNEPASSVAKALSNSKERRCDRSSAMASPRQREGGGFES
jgi:hypothetical protein